jgi:cell wall-associated NlpC family hydrolase
MYAYTPPAQTGAQQHYGARPYLASYQQQGARPYPASYQPQQGARPYLASYQPQMGYNQRPAMMRPPASQQPYEPADAPARRALLAQAHQAVGTHYKFGGETPREGFDCSGLVQYVYKNGNGVTLPRTATEQSRASRTINFAQMRPGDLIFFRTSGNSVNHVGIYIGRGQFINAASGSARVMVDNLSRPYWQQRIVKFGTFMA